MVFFQNRKCENYLAQNWLAYRRFGIEVAVCNQTTIYREELLRFSHLMIIGSLIHVPNDLHLFFFCSEPFTNPIFWTKGQGRIQMELLVRRIIFFFGKSSEKKVQLGGKTRQSSPKPAFFIGVLHIHTHRLANANLSFYFNIVSLYIEIIKSL